MKHIGSSSFKWAECMAKPALVSFLSSPHVLLEGRGRGGPRLWRGLGRPRVAFLPAKAQSPMKVTRHYWEVVPEVDGVASHGGTGRSAVRTVTLYAVHCSASAARGVNGDVIILARCQSFRIVWISVTTAWGSLAMARLSFPSFSA